MTVTAARTVIGWDIGGAHVKVALLRGGHLEAVRQWPCALWKGLHLLEAVIDEALAGWPQAQTGQIRHAVTMTGELVDLFEHREDGVIQLAQRLGHRLGPELRLFSSTGEWLGSADATYRWPDLASANWAATARLVAARVESATLVDVGSTTSDVVPLAGGVVRSRANSDAQRLCSGELVYQGVVRTPLCALTQRIMFRGAHYNVMNELFATTADAYRLTGELDPAHDQHPAADGGAKDEAGSCRRIARMIGHDARDASLAEWQAFAGQWRSHQLALLQTELLRAEAQDTEAQATAAQAPEAQATAAQDTEARADELQPPVAQVPPPHRAPLVGAGCGYFLVRALAERLGRSCVAFEQLVDAPSSLRRWACVCAPAVAVAMLRDEGWARGEASFPCG